MLPRMLPRFNFGSKNVLLFVNLSKTLALPQSTAVAINSDECI